MSTRRVAVQTWPSVTLPAGPPRKARRERKTLWKVAAYMFSLNSPRRQQPLGSTKSSASKISGRRKGCHWDG